MTELEIKKIVLKVNKKVSVEQDFRKDILLVEQRHSVSLTKGLRSSLVNSITQICSQCKQLF